MLGLNTITLISSRVGSFIKRIVTDGLKMRLPFTSAKPLGENVVVNGDFATDSDWSPSWLIYDNKANITGDGTSFVHIKQNNVFEEGKAYICVFDVTITSGLGLKFQDGANNENIGFATSSGVYTFNFTAGSNSDLVIGRRTGGTPFESYVNSVSIYESAQETPDVSGNGNNAILKTGKCLNLDGGNDKIALPSVSNIKTLALWIKPGSVSDEAVFYFGFSSGHRQVFLTNGEVNLQSISGTVYVNNVQTTSISANVWSRVVIVLDSQLTTTTFDVGHAYYQKYGDFCVSDLQVYDVDWSTADIDYDYKNPQNLVTDNLSTDIHLRNLKAWWHLSEGSGSVIHDSAPLIGGELVVNGDFAIAGNESNWVTQEGWDIENGKAIALNVPNVRRLQQNISGYTPVVGNTYRYSFNISNVDGYYTVWAFGSAILLSVNTEGLITGTFTATSTNVGFYIAGATSSGLISATIDNVSVKEVFNVDGEAKDGSALGASWEDSQERIPQLGLMDWSKGSNLLEYSEDFSNNYWSKSGVTLESGHLAPDGTLSAYKVVANSTESVINRNFTGHSIGSHYRSIWAKTTSGIGAVALMTRHDSAGSVVTITNEWQRFTINSADSLPDYFYVVDFRGGNLDEVILWGAQLEDADSVSTYRKTKGLAVTNSTLIKTPDVEQFTGNKVDRNLILYSEDFNNSYWDGRQNLTIEGGYPDPNGGNSAYKVTANETYANLLHDFHSGIQNYSRSIWAKTVSGSGTLGLLSRFNSSNSIQNITNEWQRFDVSSDDGGDPNSFYAIDFRGSSTLTEVLVYGAQLQEGGLTRYFPTYGAIAQETLPIIGKDVLGNDVETRGGALNLDGTGYGEVLDDNVFDIGVNEAFSICGWARWNYVLQNSSTLNVIFSNGLTIGTGDNFSISSRRYSDGNKVVSAYINGAQINTTTNYTNGDWFYFAFTRRAGGGNNTCTLYTSKIDQSGNWVVTSEGNTSNNARVSNSYPKLIGWDGTVNDRKYHDLIDDIKFYDRKLELDEIEQNFNATKSAHTN